MSGMEIAGVVAGVVLTIICVGALVCADYLAAGDRQRERRHLERSGRPGRW